LVKSNHIAKAGTSFGSFDTFSRYKSNTNACNSITVFIRTGFSRKAIKQEYDYIMETWYYTTRSSLGMACLLADKSKLMWDHTRARSLENF